MGRVHDLVAAACGELPQQAMQMALTRRAQIELWLLDQDDETVHPGLDQSGDRTDE